MYITGDNNSVDTTLFAYITGVVNVSLLECCQWYIEHCLLKNVSHLLEH